MAAFRQLPFQFQQRGPDLAEAKDATLAKFHEQRDQDLENYLAGIGGARQSFTIWGASTINGGSTDVLAGGNIDWACFGGTGGFDGAGAWSGSPTALGVFYYEITVSLTSNTIPGLADVSVLLEKRLQACPAPGGTITYQISLVSSPGGTPGGGINADPVNLDLQTSTGGLVGPDNIQFLSASCTILVVD